MEPTEQAGPRPALYQLPRAASRFGLPDGYAEAVALFDEASGDYEQRKPEEAAPKFLEVARLLGVLRKKTTYSDAFTKMRAVSYRNAAIAFAEAKHQSEGKKALEAAAAADSENAALLRELAANL